jgi:hypothetical protein
MHVLMHTNVCVSRKVKTQNDLHFYILKWMEQQHEVV